MVYLAECLPHTQKPWVWAQALHTTGCASEHLQSKHLGNGNRKWSDIWAHLWLSFEAPCKPEKCKRIREQTTQDPPPPAPWLWYILISSPLSSILVSTLQLRRDSVFPISLYFLHFGWLFHYWNLQCFRENISIHYSGGTGYVCPLRMYATLCFQ